MHTHIRRLYEISIKPSRLIIGLMSGTSLDGLDVALCRVVGTGVDTKVDVLSFKTINYDKHYQEKVRQVFSKRHVDLQMVTLLNAWIGRLHGEMVLQCLKQWQVPPQKIDIIASHGQTIFHCPKSQHGLDEFPNATLQIGDGDHLAVTTGIITISDFRQKHIASGGEGAPLAIYGDFLLFGSNREQRILLNLGGIANFTYLPRKSEDSYDKTKVFSTDVGPSNTLMDAYVQQNFSGLSFDKDSMIAKSGKVNSNLLKTLKSDLFFSLEIPKTTGPELFNLAFLACAQKTSNTTKLAKQDVLATLNRFSAEVIADAIKSSIDNVADIAIYVSGGGIYNELLMSNIAELTGIKLQTTAKLAVAPDAKEAVLFAVLANECLVGEGIEGNNENTLGKSDQGLANITMGKISFAD